MVSRRVLVVKEFRRKSKLGHTKPTPRDTLDLLILLGKYTIEMFDIAVDERFGGEGVFKAAEELVGQHKDCYEVGSADRSS